MRIYSERAPATTRRAGPPLGKKCPSGCKIVQRQRAFPRTEEGGQVLPLHQDPGFTFRFADDRLIPRFHLEGVSPGRPVSVFRIDPGTGERLGLLATATAGAGGWVDLTAPLVVRAGEAFVAVPAP